MISEKLKEAQQFEDLNAYLADEERPDFHLTGRIGWINDPNGFSIYKDEIHLFYQYHPFSTQWGPMHWGHVKSKDFITWERLPIALAPDTKEDDQGCFSGSAIEMDDKHVLLYTGVKNKGNLQIQQQCIAIGDGLSYKKYDGNPVISSKDLPEGFSEIDFRDPKMFIENGIYYCVVGSRSKDGSGAILMYESTDILHWKFKKIIDSCFNEYGKIWECPDFFELDNKQVLFVSPQEMEPDGLEFHNGYGTVCFIGSYKNFEFNREKVQAVDYGIDFYAPQTLKTKDGRRIMIAWMQNWANMNCQPKNNHIFGCLTIPREIHIRDNRLYQYPVKEIEKYWTNKIVYKNVNVFKEQSLNGISGRIIDLSVTIHPTENNYRWFKCKVDKDNKHYVLIEYNQSKNTLKIDRTLSGGSFDIVHMREFYIRNQNGLLKLRILLDKNSLECFVNDGEQAASFTIFSPIHANQITFESEQPVFLDIEKYDLKR